MSEKQFVLHGFLRIHKAILKNLANYAEKVNSLSNVSNQQVRNLRKSFYFNWEIIEDHHLNEDNRAFPSAAKRDPQFAQHMDALIADHHEIDDLVMQIGDALDRIQVSFTPEDRTKYYEEFRQLVNTMNEKMADHIVREEAIVIPSIIEYFPVEEQRAMEAAILKYKPLEHHAIQLPWTLQALEAEERQAAFQALPPQLQQLYNTVWVKDYNNLIASFAA